MWDRSHTKSRSHKTCTRPKCFVSTKTGGFAPQDVLVRGDGAKISVFAVRQTPVWWLILGLTIINTTVAIAATAAAAVVVIIIIIAFMIIILSLIVVGVVVVVIIIIEI